MLTAVNPKLPMRDKAITQNFYINTLGFSVFGNANYDGYLMLEKDHIQIHFFEFKSLNPLENYGQLYIRTTAIHQLYESIMQKVPDLKPVGELSVKPWGQVEFSLLDPDNNLLTFGQTI